MRYRAVLFDLDGVLIDSSEAWFQVVGDAADRWNLPRISRERFHECFGQSVEDDVRTLFPTRTVQEVADFYERGFARQIDYIAVDPDAKQVLRELEVRGVGTAIITNTPSALSRRILSRLGIGAKVMLGDGDVPHPKPAPDLVLEACRILEVEPASALVVGDTHYDREAAQAAGASFAGMRIEGDYSLVRLRDVLRIATGVYGGD